MRTFLIALCSAALLAAVFAGSTSAAAGDITATEVADIVPGSGSSSPAAMTNVNGTVFFTADDGTNGNELWKSDGTAAGTKMMDPAGGGINPGAADSSPYDLVNVNGILYFGATDATNGKELWKSDGTSAGTTMVDNSMIPDGGIYPGVGNANPGHLASANGTLYFEANDGSNGVELWKTDGTPAGTTMLAPSAGGIAPGGANSNPTSLTNVNGTLFLRADDGTNGRELWKSDGTSAGTTMVDDDVVPNGGINPGVAGSSPYGITNVNGIAFFGANDGTDGFELWKSDGTPTGTTMIEDSVIPDGGIYPGAGNANPDWLTNVNGTLFFTALDGTNGNELWKTDGTQAGTSMVNSGIDLSAGIGPYLITDVNGTVFFGANDGTNGEELWKTDGTSLGTTMVVPPDGIAPGPAGSGVDHLTAVNNTLFFTAADGTNGPELWKSDGTAAGTKMVDAAVPGNGINPGVTGSGPNDLADVNGTLYFAAYTDSHGYELWKTTTEAALPGSPPGASAPGPTGQRAAALKKCKKKKSSKARSKCKKKAKKLPV